MKPYPLLASFLAMVLSASTSLAEKRPITPQDLWAVKRLSDPALSPDGRTVVFTVQEWSIEKDKSTSSLWLVDVAGGEPRRFTTATGSDGSATWSPDGRRIAFTSKRAEDEAAALYVIAVDGGEPEKVLELPFGLSHPKWLPDGSGLIVATTVIPELAGSLAPEDLKATRKEIGRRKNSKISARVTENRLYRFWDRYLTDTAASRLLKVTLATREITDLTPHWDRLFTIRGTIDYDLSPDGQWIALTLDSTPPPHRDFPNHDICLVPTDGSGALKNITPDNPGGDDGPVFAPDGQSLVFGRRPTAWSGGELTRLWRHDLATGQNTALTGALDHSFRNVRFSPDGKTLWATVEDQGVVPVFRLGADGAGLAAVYAEGASGGLDLAAGSIVFLNDTTSRPAELFALDAATGRARALTHFNDALIAGLDLGRVESYRFAGADGDQVQGWLVYPPGYDAAKTWPLVQLMHGGPHTMAADSWNHRWNSHVLAAPGYLVTWVNRHGSTGFGEKFARSLVNQWGEKPFEDIMKGTDHLLAKLPNIDRDRLAAAGPSYGGYLAAWLLGHTDRFKAIVNHAGVNDFYAQLATDIPHLFPEIMGGTPWGDVAGMQRHNPLFYAKNFKTPTLLLHGELDYRVPCNNSLELHGVLQALGVPSRLVLFPDENHWILKPRNAIYWNWEVQNWLSRHIGGEPVIEKPVFDGRTE